MIKPLFQIETQGQIAMGDALNFALRNKKIVFIKDNHGSGFHFYLKKYNSIYPDMRIAQFTLANNLDNDATISMFRDLNSNIKILNKNYNKLDVHGFLTVLTNRAKLDLRGKQVLIVFDRFEKLKGEEKLRKFFKYLELLKLPCGIVIRTNTAHIEMIKQKYEDLFVYINQFDRKTIERVSEREVVAFCNSYGVYDKILTEQISKQTKNLKLVYQYLVKKVNLQPTTQFSLFG